MGRFVTLKSKKGQNKVFLIFWGAGFFRKWEFFFRCL